MDEKEFFESIERFTDRHKNKTKEQRQAFAAFWDLLAKAIEEKDTSFSIVETQKALGLYK
jgi:hypothetical protein